MDTTLELNVLLSDLQVFRQKAQGYHWCIEGQDFFVLHPVFGTLYEDAASFIDKVAERIRQLDAYPHITMSQFVQESGLDEDQVEDATTSRMVEALVDDLDHLCTGANALAKGADSSGDRVTAMLMDDLSSTFGKHLWMLRSHQE